MGIPIHDDEMWAGLSFTRELHKGSLSWTGKVRGSLARLDDEDGAFLTGKLTSQAAQGKAYPLSEQDRRKLATHTVNRPEKVVSVSVPEDAGNIPTADVIPDEVEARESIRMQALIATIGARMRMSIWIPRSDRGAVLGEWKNEGNSLLGRLPLNYDDTTLRTIEQIDVLWLRGRSITRAFEVEHTTSVYSGILRMADLLALQPNMDIKLHIVAPEARREKVFQEIRRPVFLFSRKGRLLKAAPISHTTASRSWSHRNTCPIFPTQCSTSTLKKQNKSEAGMLSLMKLVAGARRLPPKIHSLATVTERA